MELTQEIIKKIKGLIVFTAVIFMCFWKYDVVFDVCSFVFHIVYPFMLGGAIAFVLNVPMNFIERHLFRDKKKVVQEDEAEIENDGKNYKQKRAARFVSLLIVIIGVIGIIVLILFVLVPQLVKTFSNLGGSIQEFIPKIQNWTDKWFHNNKEIMNLVNNLEFDWNKIMDTWMDFLKNGAENVLESTINTAKNIISAISTFFIAFSFSVYILVQKEKLSVQAKKVLFAFVRKGRAEATLEVLSLTYHTFSNFLTGQCFEAIILGTMFAVSMTILRLPYALLMGIVIAFTALIPIFGAFIGCGCLFDFYGRSVPGLNIYYFISCIAASRRKFDLSTCCGEFSRTSINLGAGSSQRRWKSYGNQRNVDFYTYCISAVCII